LALVASIPSAEFKGIFGLKRGINNVFCHFVIRCMITCKKKGDFGGARKKQQRKAA